MKGNTIILTIVFFTVGATASSFCDVPDSKVLDSFGQRLSIEKNAAKDAAFLRKYKAIVERVNRKLKDLDVEDVKLDDGSKLPLGKRVSRSRKRKEIAEFADSPYPALGCKGGAHVSNNNNATCIEYSAASGKVKLPREFKEAIQKANSNLIKAYKASVLKMRLMATSPSSQSFSSGGRLSHGQRDTSFHDSDAFDARFTSFLGNASGFLATTGDLSFDKKTGFRYRPKLVRKSKQLYRSKSSGIIRLTTNFEMDHRGPTKISEDTLWHMAPHVRLPEVTLDIQGPLSLNYLAGNTENERYQNTFSKGGGLCASRDRECSMHLFSGVVRQMYSDVVEGSSVCWTRGKARDAIDTIFGKPSNDSIRSTRGAG